MMTRLVKEGAEQLADPLAALLIYGDVLSLDWGLLLPSLWQVLVLLPVSS